jgi:hypothetical protein
VLKEKVLVSAAVDMACSVVDGAKLARLKKRVKLKKARANFF